MPTTVKKTVPTNKVVTKVASKKVATKPKKAVVAKKSTAKSLVYADNDKSFWVNDGQILNSLRALHEAFAKMEKSVYTHHVAKGKNDFANWVETVLGDSACAADLRKVKAPSGAKDVVAKYLKEYKV